MKDVAVALAILGGKLFLQQREPGGLFAGLWELPGGKLEPGERPERAVVREVREELACGFEIDQALEVLEQDYGTFRVRLHGFLGRFRGNPETPLVHGWFGPETWAGLALPEATRRLLATVEQMPEDP